MEQFNIGSHVDFPPLKGISSEKKVPTQSPAAKSPPSSSTAQNIEILTESTSSLSLESTSVIKNSKSNEQFVDEKEKESTKVETLRGSNIEEKKVVEYMVCAVEEKGVIGVRRNPAANKQYPHFVSIDNNIAAKCEGFVEKLNLGDLVFISEMEWKKGYEELARNAGEVTRDRKMWYVGKINTQANATVIELIDYATRRNYPGVVIKIKRGGKFNTLMCCLVISAGLQVASRCYRRQLNDFTLEQLEIGQLVTVSVASVPQDCLVDEAYVLPPQTEFKIGSEEVLRIGMGVIGTVGAHSPWPYRREGKNIFYPLTPEMSYEEVELAESVISAAIGYSSENERKEIVENRFEGCSLFVDNRFELRFSNIDNSKVKKLKNVWKVDDQVMLKSEMHLPHFAIGAITSVEFRDSPSFGNNKKFDFWVVVIIVSSQERKNRDVVEELEYAKDRGYIVVHPVLFKGLESRRECFASNLPSRIARTDTDQGKLMRALLAREVEVIDEDEDDSDTSVIEQMHPLMRLLNARQQVTAKSLLKDGCQFTFQQAPPGVGKTYVASVVVAILLSVLNDVKVAVITAANLPLAKLAKELEEILGSAEMEDSGAIAFFSGYAKEKYRDSINELRQHMLISKLALNEERMDNEMRRDCREYSENFERRPRLTKEKRIGSMFSEISQLRIVFATSTMAEEMVGNALLDTSVLIFDEATQGSFAELANLVCRLPKLEKILVTGDKYQLGVHLQDLPSSLHEGFGLESMVDQLVGSSLVRHTRLVTCYRMHPLLVHIVSYASYEQHGESLEPGTAEEDRTLLTLSRFPLPMQNVPIVLLNIIGTCRQDSVSHSLTNDEQTTSVVNLVSALYNYISPDVSLVVICLYLYQKECLQKEFENLGWNVLVVSVDGYQAQESDLVVLVTTRSRRNIGNLGDTSDFLRDDCRATVALSRAKHGLFLVGDVEILRSGTVWNRFLDKASEYTHIVGSEYLNVLRSGRCKRDRFGQLLSADGRTVSDFSDEIPFEPQQEIWTNTRRNECWRNEPSTSGTSSNRNVRREDWFEGDDGGNTNKNTNPFYYRKDSNWKQWAGRTVTRSNKWNGGNSWR
ncbi:unnamed protein product [Meloidogyne enterolobii]|uniref:Uncharacterized protein n=1 Tax=Meloidogyne enterolobii TaxID=390850 RepID=A0ACB0Z2N3_MELEN